MINKLLVVVLLFGAATVSAADFPFYTGKNTSPTGFMSYINSQIDVIPVSIHGAGLVAGTYYVPPALRVLDVVRNAGGESLRLANIDCRNVIIRSEKTSTTLDLLRYISLGDETQNPYVTNGMDITLSFPRNTVWIQGDIRGELFGQVPLKGNETLKEFLSLYSFNPTADKNAILFRRYDSAIRVLSLDSCATIKLQDRDYISVLPKPGITKQTSVRLDGEASRPGWYPVVHGVTTVGALIALGGGVSAEGDSTRTYIIRRNAASNTEGNAPRFSEEGAVRPEIAAGVRHLALSRDFTVIPDVKGNEPLEDGDVIVVPRRELCVYVSGAVKHPGAIPFLSGQECGYYIGKAGGYGKSADKINVRIVTPWSDGVFAITQAGRVRAGDVVMVPEAEENKWLKKWVPVLQLFATTLSLVITLWVVSK